MYFTISLMFFILVSNNKEEVKMNAPYKYDIVGSFLRDKEIFSPFNHANTACDVTLSPIVFAL